MTKLSDSDLAFDVLRQHGWLARMPEAFARQLFARGSLLTARSGDCVYRSGEPQDGLRGVISGALAIEIAPFERGPNLLHLFRPGAWFGEAETFEGMPKIATITATRPSQYIHITSSEIEKLATLEPSIWRWIGALASEHLIIALGLIDDMTIRDPAKRIAALLLRLADVRTTDNPHDPQPEVDVTQSDLAHLANVSRATIVTHLHRMEKHGLISKAYGRLKLLRTDAMRARIASGS